MAEMVLVTGQFICDAVDADDVVKSLRAWFMEHDIGMDFSFVAASSTFDSERLGWANKPDI